MNRLSGIEGFGRVGVLRNSHNVTLRVLGEWVSYVIVIM